MATEGWGNQRCVESMVTVLLFRAHRVGGGNETAVSHVFCFDSFLAYLAR